MANAKPGVVHDANYLVTWVDALADPSAPTTTELNAGIDLECQITPDGLAREASDESVDTSRLCSDFTAMKVGRTSFEVSLTLKRVDETSGATDEAYQTLKKGKEGFLVVRDKLPSDQAYASGDEVETYPSQVGTRSKSTPAANEEMTYTVPFMITSKPDLYAVVA